MKAIITTIVILSAFNALSQTVVKNVPIEAKDPYIIKVWAVNTETIEFGWYDITETGLESTYGWYYNQEINIKIEPKTTGHFMFIRGFDDCADTTRLTIYGSFSNEVIKDKPDLRKQFFVNGQDQTFGTMFKTPEY